MGRIASTKSKIIYNALRLFNERGFVNVNLRDIASATGISVGNLAYHYANKSVIIAVLYERMESSLHVFWEGLNQEPSFAN
ncbi:MAG: TetR family transcriptional regulator, partial [Bacteroidota bacterium]